MGAIYGSFESYALGLALLAVVALAALLFDVLSVARSAGRDSARDGRVVHV